ncbi:pyruvate ferredoxin oxidoreductase [Candidatus Aerophobetes bacterium]|nr:pyruvate ferredoxin oxidoreductase [Candidatus Aerophobetes bacterium]
MPSLKELSKKKELLSGGQRLCAGCGASIIVRQILMAAEDPLVISCATGCLEVATTIYPFSAWRIPFIHCAFENSASTLSGAEAAYRSLKRQGKIDRTIKFIAFGGDGGTYDIGLQALSGVLERGHNLLYVCYDNGAYMNTGIQRSSATPQGAATTTSPVGKAIPEGKQRPRKDLTQIVVAHDSPYVAQANPAYYNDLIKKVQKALNTEGPTFINILSPCPRGWRYESSQSIQIAKLATLTGFWPLYEVENGKYRITYRPKKRRPFREWLESQGRFKHLLSEKNKGIIERLEREVEEKENKLLALAGETPSSA